MKNKLPFIIIVIVFILGISISFLFKRKDSKGDYENDYISKILVDNVDIGVTYKAGNCLIQILHMEMFMRNILI